MKPIERLNKSVTKLLKIRHLDLASFSYNFERMVNNIYFFNNSLCANCQNESDVSNVQYKLPLKERPKEGQVAFFYIENSYPKEIFNSHWCLILKDFGSLMLVVPMTSVKSDSSEIYESTEIDVKIKDFENDGISRLHVDQIFSADIMRIDKSKPIYDLDNDFEVVKNKIFERIFPKPLDKLKELCYNMVEDKD